MRKFIIPFFCLFVFSSTSLIALEYDGKSMVPIPPAEKNLPSEVAVHFKNVSDKPIVLEGAQFANDGTLFFCDVTGSRIIKLTPDNKLEVIIELGDLHPSGLAFHPDGRLFAAGNKDNISRGAIIAMQPDGSGLTTILPEDAGFIPNDLVITPEGGIYFTDFKGTMTKPEGGVHYLAPGAKEPVPVMPGISNANGIALSPDGRTLWVGDYGRSILSRIILTGDTEFNRIHSTPVYYFTGRGPDSMRVDRDGNLYVAIMSQGRTMVFNPNGIPIGQILLPERDSGHNLFGTSVAINPLNRDIILVAMDDRGKGANLFRAKAFAGGLAAPVSR